MSALQRWHAASPALVPTTTALEGPSWLSSVHRPQQIKSAVLQPTSFRNSMGTPVLRMRAIWSGDMKPFQ